MALLFEEQTRALIGCFFEVHNAVGVGFDERTYHQALECRLRAAGIGYRSRERKALIHRGCKVREFEVNFIAGEDIVLELKALQSAFLQANYVQIISELKLWQKSLGLLVNFGLHKVYFQRIPYSEKPKQISENYEHLPAGLSREEEQLLVSVREAICSVMEIHGLGFGETVYRRLLAAELDFRGIHFRRRAPIQVEFEGKHINTFVMKPLLIENRVICDLKALRSEIDFYDIAKIQSYLRSLRLDIGLIANFGKHELEIRAIHA